MKNKEPVASKWSLSGGIFLIWLGILTVLPFTIILFVSLLERGPHGELVYSLGIQNYVRCFSWLYARVFYKTLLLSLGATLSCLLIGFPVAYFLARSQGILKQVGLLLLFIPFWTNFILRIHAMVSLLGNHGLLNQLIMGMGIRDEPLSILYTRLGVYLGLIYNYLPFLVIPIYSSLEKLDGSWREAAYDLGANRIQTFWRVILPNAKEGVLVGSLFVFIPMLGEYVIPDLLGGAKEVFLGNIMVSQFFVMQDWPFGSAIAGFLALLLLCALAIQHRFKTSLKTKNAF